MNIKKGDMVSIKQDFIDRNNRYEYDSRDIWEVKEVYKIGGGYHVAVINNLTGYGNAHLCTYNMDLRTIDDLKARLLQEESGSFNDKMLEFIDMVFKHDTMNEDYGVKILDDIWYHEIGSVFKYNIGSKEVELEVVKSSDASCEGCVFNNSKNYHCKDTRCIDIDREDDIDVIYKEVKKS